MNQRLRASVEIDRFCAIVLIGYAIYVVTLYPWYSDVGCLRSGPLILRRLTIIAELGIFVPYTWMPVSLVLMWRAAKARPEAKILVLYGAFIVLCGLTHLVGAIGIPWVESPDGSTGLYWIAMKLKSVTAAVSLTVARVTDKHRAKLLEISSRENELARERDEATAARAEAERQAEDARVARAELELARAQDAARALREASRAQTAEHKNAELETAMAEIQARDRLLAAQGTALRVLSTPILTALDGVLVTVLVGAIDSVRAADWMQRLTAQVQATRARLVIIDMTALDVVDTQVAESIIRTARVVRVQGSRCVLTGAQPHVSMTIVGLGIDLRELPALPTLREALEMAAKDGRKL